ncbi:NPLOC4 family protein [Megaselia abdita]
MSTKDKILVRVQSPEGLKRIELSKNTNIKDLYELVRETLKLEDYGFSLFKERNFTSEIISSRSQTIASQNIKHGDMIFFKQVAGISERRASAVAIDKISSAAASQSFQPVLKNEVKEDPVDLLLAKEDGRIKRERDSKLCHHNLNGCCIHCSAIEPYDEGYLKEKNIKHLSFHSYLRKQTSGMTGGKFVAFEDLNCKIKSGCREHLPWPKGICSKCQPSAITLNRQTYRHVDNVMFENTAIVERFLEYWRNTGHQRMGYLYGQYEVLSDVPLGIRARVAAIYEPPQESSRDSIKLLDDDNANDVEEVAKALGLCRVGWIFTDLISENASAGTVKHIRGIETHFLTAQECILAGNLQNSHPNPCRYASNSVFGSKFITVCVTGDKLKQVHMEGYAVSAQCMALVRDDCLIPTKDAPELGYIRESSDKQYVPDVYYKDADQYGNEVQRLARPLPVEYLLVDVPASTPLQPIYTFTPYTTKKSFPIENRYIDGHLQDFTALGSYFSSWPMDSEFLEAVSDFHLLIYLYKMEMLPMKTQMQPLLEAVRTQNKDQAYEFKKNETWSLLESLVGNEGGVSDGAGTSKKNGAAAGRGSSVSSENLSNSGDNEGGAGGSGTGGSTSWTCDHCTFINGSVLSSCEMCGLPR